MEYYKITNNEEFDADAQCLCKYVYGRTDRFFPHHHEFYEIFLIVSGTVEHWINGEEQKLPEGSLVFIRPNDTHGFLYTNPENLKNIYINLSFTKQTADSLFEYLSDEQIYRTVHDQKMPPRVILNRNAKDRLILLLNELNTINKEDKRTLNLRVKTILTDILTQYFSDFIRNNDNQIPLWLSNLMKEMERIDNFTAGIERMVTLSGKSREHLSRCLKKYTGMTVTEYINGLRINYATNLMINSNMSIIDICYASGFQNLGYFYKLFRNTYNTSPNSFKKQFSRVQINLQQE